jgi:hypothetical protein
VLRVIELGRARVTVLHPDHMQEVLPGNTAPTLPYLAGFTVTADTAQVAKFLERQAVEFQLHDGRILVNAREACGCSILFEHPTVGR